MSDNSTQDQWLEKVVELLRAREGVECEDLDDGRLILELSYNAEPRKVSLATDTGDYRTLKNQYNEIRKALTRIGIKEGAEYVAPKRSRKPMSPAMAAARTKQRKEFEAWQEVWRTVRQAEQALDVDYEIAQMKDYY